MNTDNKLSLKRYIIYLVLTAAAVLAVLNFSAVIAVIAKIIGVITPLVLGGVMAYIFNLIMRRIEKSFFPKTKKKALISARRPVCLVASILLVFVIVGLLCALIIPEIVNIFDVLSQTLPVYGEKIKQFVMENQDNMPVLSEYIQGIINDESIDWKETLSSAVDFAANGVGGILSSAMGLISSVAGGVVNFAIGLIFSIYILYNKEKLSAQANTLLDCYLKSETAYKIRYVVKEADKCFSSFIVGQCTEAVILGLLCALGMTVLKLPYASTIGTLIGATALIPVVGAYIGAVVGVLMIIVVDPFKALVFVVFLVILQQLEGNIIYPKVVGSSIGLPGMWVLAAVTVGGGIGGVGGMLIGVPAAATVYRLVGNDIKKRTGTLDKTDAKTEEKKEVGPENISQTRQEEVSEPVKNTQTAEKHSNTQSRTQGKSRKGGKGRKR